MVRVRGQRGQLVEGSTEGELPRPRSQSNGTEPCLAHPRKVLLWTCLRTTSRPLSTGHGSPLELPVNSSTRDPLFATRSMGVMGTSPLCPARGGAKGRTNKPESSPRSPQVGPGSGGSTHGCTSWTYPNAGKCRYARMTPPRPAEILSRMAETNTSHECASTPHGTAQRPRGKKVPSGSTNLCGFLRIPLQRLGGYCRGRP
jgi:hypothetical protein